MAEQVRMLNKTFWMMVAPNRKGGYVQGLALPRVAAKNSARSGEVAIQVNVSLPLTLFTKPQLKADIAVDPSQVSGAVIDADVINNIEELVASQLGIELTISAETVEDE